MKVAGIAVLCLGALMLVLTLLLAVSERQFLQRASHTTGTVIQLIEHRTRKGSRSWTPRVRFQDSSGETRDFEGSVGSFPAANRVGDTVKVIYDATQADIDSSVSRWLKCWVVGGMSVVFLGLGYALRRS